MNHMNIEDQINNDIKQAMLAKEASKLEALRSIKSSILLLKTSPEGLTEDSALKAMQKMVKQREETAEIYIQQGRADLAEAETFQAAIIKQYLPKQMDEAELKEVLKNIIQSVGASSANDLGKVMGIASKQLAGKADGKLISSVVKQLLS